MKAGTLIAAIVFVLIALAHVLRLVFGVHVSVGTTEIPVWVSVAGIVVALALALMLLREGCGVCGRKTLGGVKGQHAPQ
jgi:protein-S-isoprenylcysteine O-methyltransferase Ste14